MADNKVADVIPVLSQDPKDTVVVKPVGAAVSVEVQPKPAKGLPGLSSQTREGPTTGHQAVGGAAIHPGDVVVSPNSVIPRKDYVVMKPNNVHYGTNSVHPTDVMEYSWKAGAPMGQDIIRRVAECLTAVKRRCRFSVNTGHVVLGDEIVWHRMLGGDVDEHVHTQYPVIWRADRVNLAINVEQVDIPAKTQWRLEDEPSILIGGTPDMNAIVKKLRGCSDISRPIAEKCASRITRNLEIYDTTGFWACGYLFATHLFYCRQFGVVINWHGLAANQIITANLATFDDAGVAQVMTSINKALNEQCLAFRFSQLSPVDIQVIMTIAQGGVASVVRNAQAVNMAFTELFTWPTRHYFIWDTKDFALPEQRLALTHEQVLQSLVALATLLDRMDDLAAGFVKASTLVLCMRAEWNVGLEGEDATKAGDNVVEIDENALRPATPGCVCRFYKSAAELAAESKPSPSPARSKKSAEKLAPAEPPKKVKIRPVRAAILTILEARTIQIPKVKGHNFLWDLMKTPKPAGFKEPLLVDDGEALRGMEATQTVCVMLTIGGILSVSASTFFHNANFTGRELNLWAANGGAISSNLLDGVLTVTDNSTNSALFYRAVIGGVQTLSRFTIHPNVLAHCYQFSGRGNDMELLDEYTWWVNLWARWVPYMTDPLSLSWAWKALAPHWGLTGPSPTVDFTEDAVIGGPNDYEYISFHKGEPKYIEQASSNTPYLYIRYGALAIGIMRHLAAWPVDDWPIVIRRVKRTMRGSGDLEPPINNFFQPAYYPELAMIKPGTLITWDWDTQSILVPGITKHTLGNALFHQIIRMGKQTIEGAGITRSVTAAQGAPAMLLSLASCFEGLGTANATAEGSSEN